MNTTVYRRYSIGLLCAAALTLLPAAGVAQTEKDMLDAARAVLRTDRRTAIQESMQFTEAEAKAFWPLYDAYRTEMDKTGDKIQKLVLAYAAAYPDVTTENAKNGLKEMLQVEKQLAATRATHLAKIAKVLPPVKALRFAQVDMRLDVADRLKVSVNIPLVPIEGKIALKTSVDTFTTAGQAGLASVTTIELSAKVIAIDRADRSLTLLGKDGIRETITVSDDVMNFDQVKVGDDVLMLLSDSLLVQMGESVAGARPEAVVKIAPVGAKPSGVVANTIEIRGTVVGLDAAKRTATLKSDDGVEKTYPVRADVDMSRIKVGDRILARKTEAVALRITTP